MRRIPIPELLRHGGRAGFARWGAPARAFARRGGVPAVLAAAMLVAAPSAAGDGPLVSLAVYGTMGTNGWYVSDVTLNWSFGGPLYSSTGCSNATVTADTPGTTFACTATSLDRTLTMSISKTIKLDKTPPTLSKLAVKAGDRSVILRWVASDAQLVQVSRTSKAQAGKSGLVFSGTGKSFRDARLKAGARYHYTVKVIDQAGNNASKRIAVKAPGALFAPMPGERISTPPVLSWTPAKGAQYYNVQLVRGKKILSAWPGTNHFRVPRSWVFEGHRYRLHRGVYRWYIWPGFGTFAANKYGSPLGGSSFVFSPG
jgi:hypothetical protein